MSSSDTKEAAKDKGEGDASATTSATSGAGPASKDSKTTKKLTNEQIVGGFNSLRQEQRAMSQKVVEFESEAGEHQLVIDALKGVDPNRKCFRLIGGVLVERTVKEVLPPLENNREKLGQLVDSLKQSIVTKGKEINEYMEKHNIQIRQADQAGPEPPGEGDKDQAIKTGGGQGVLVDSS